VHYNPYVEPSDPKLVCEYNITDISSPTFLRTEHEQNQFRSMEIDGVMLDNLVTSYQFSTTGKHIVKYELYDETKVGNNAPLFQYVRTLTSVTIPNSVTSIGCAAFYNCTGLISVTVKVTIPPTLGCDGVFGGGGIERKIYVPSESVNAYKTATYWSAYASNIEAIPTP
jgi:hypothetical protein